MKRNQPQSNEKEKNWKDYCEKLNAMEKKTRQSQQTKVGSLKIEHTKIPQKLRLMRERTKTIKIRNKMGSKLLTTIIFKRSIRKYYEKKFVLMN